MKIIKRILLGFVGLILITPVAILPSVGVVTD